MIRMILSVCIYIYICIPHIWLIYAPYLAHPGLLVAPRVDIIGAQAKMLGGSLRWGRFGGFRIRNGGTKKTKGIHGIYMDLYGSIWNYLDLYGFIWNYMDV